MKPPRFRNLNTAIERIADDPALYHEFILAWDELVSHADTGDERVEAVARDAVLRATRAEQQTLLRNSFAQDLNRFPYPTWLCAVSGEVLAANTVSVLEHGLEVGQKLSELRCELSAAEPIPNVLAKLLASGTHHRDILLKKAYFEGNTAPVTMAFLPSRLKFDNQPTSLVFLVAPQDSDEAFGPLQTSFDLTDAELAILRGFLAGRTLAEIAHDRDRALATVRTQFNAILAKTETSTQADLVRTCLGLVSFTDAVSKLARANRPSQRRTVEVLRPLGRSVEVTLVGDPYPYSSPVIYLHGAFVSSFPPHVEDAFLRAGFSLIGITRPGFGRTSRVSPGTSTKEGLAQDIAAVLDQIGIERCPILAHSTSTHFAYSLLDMLHDRISGLAFAAGWPPPDLMDQIKARSTWSRVMMAAAVKSPALLKLMSRAGLALFKSQGAARQASRAVAESPADVRTVARADCAAELDAWMEHGSLQGLDAGLEDIAMMLQDWRPHLTRAKAPVIYVHGEEDPHVPFDIIDKFAQQSGGKVQAKLVPDAGHFALWQNPNSFIEALASMDESSSL